LTRGAGGSKKIVLASTNTQDVLVLNLEEKVRPDLLDLPMPGPEEQMIMKRKTIIFGHWYHRAGSGRAVLFAFQVRTTEVAVVTNFGEAPAITQPGLKIKLPPPIQYVHKFDQRIHNFREQVRTGSPLPMATVC